MPHRTPLSFDDLEAAFEWVSAAAPCVNSAYISRETGKVLFASIEFGTEDELPPDIEDGTRYLSVPHKNELDLGRDLVLRFIEEELPGEYDTVRSFFSRRGAYARYKELLQRRGLLDKWYEYESRATERALRSWAREDDIAIADSGAETET